MREYLWEAIKAVPADYIEVRIEETIRTRVDFVGRELEQIGTVERRGGCVRVLSNGGWGFASFNNLDALRTNIQNAADMARLVGNSGARLVPITPVVAEYMMKWGKDPIQISLSEKQQLCERYNHIILNTPKVQTTSVRYRDIALKKYLLTSEGTYISQQGVFCGISLAAIAKEGNNIQQSHFSTGDFRGYAQVEGLEDRAESVAKAAVDLLSAEQISGGKYTVIIDPKLCGVFVHEAFGHLSEADFLYENPHLQELMPLGARFGADDLSIVDFPGLEGEAGYYPYDDEGVPGTKTYLIKDGILSNRLHCRETAAVMNEPLSGNARAIDYAHEPIVRMSNTYLEPRGCRFEEMFEGVSHGIYAKGAIGGMTNCEMFTFSAEEAFLIENGKITKPLREVVLTGNVFETLSNIDAIGDDVVFYGGLGGCGKAGQSPLPVSTGGPHIRVQNVTIGGR
ncbi:TldD/PmbA family protein [bacterium]|nr:TldD/PmbA family protein [bacterium]MBU1752633.1 TldD/PmbA family protein [bacterium]